VGRVALDSQLRRDAAANRERILETAGRLFADQGLETSMDEVARAAGVGAGTLYRRFPTKEVLVDAILGDGLERFRGFVQAALREDDAFAGLGLFLERSLGLQLENRALLELLRHRLHHEPQLAEARQRIRPLLSELVARGQAQGALRDDLVAADVLVLLWALGRVVESTGLHAPDLWRRYLALALDGLRPAAATPLPQAAPSWRQLDDAMLEPTARPRLAGGG
jgi:AcrR family transcriptional regulator